MAHQCSLTGFLSLALGMGAAVLVTPACSDDKPPPKLTTPELTPNPLPRYLRGTVLYEAELRGYGRSLVQGYGVVVGLDGTGSADTPLPIRAYLEREGAKLLPDPRIETERRITMTKLLQDKNTAAVLVQAVIPAGAVKGTRFDVMVSAAPGSSTTSLEGGRLWTTNLSSGFTGAVQGVKPVAQAHGDLFINPFAPDDRNSLAGGVDWGLPDPSAPEGQSSSAGVVVDRRVARILNGGVLTDDMPLILQLRTPNFGRARAIIDAINSRFPQEPSQTRPTADPVAGHSDEQILITVPPSRHADSEVFVETMLHTQIFQGGIESRANFLAQWITENPIDAVPVTWCWVALGELAINGFSHLYTYPDVIPRLAALNAGARLGDPRVVPHLVEVAVDPDNALRVDAINLLGDMPASPRISLALRELLNDESFDVRVATFDALLKQRDPLVKRMTLDPQQEFEVYAVPSEKRMVYATLQDKPQLVVFGSDNGFADEVLVQALSDRLQIVRYGSDEPLRVRYRSKGALEAVEYEPPSDLIGFITFLGARPSQYSLDPSLGLTYGETVRVLYESEVQRGLNVRFVPERNTLMQAVIDSIRNAAPDERPETTRDPSLLDADPDAPPAESTIHER